MPQRCWDDPGLGLALQSLLVLAWLHHGAWSHAFQPSVRAWLTAADLNPSTCLASARCPAPPPTVPSCRYYRYTGATLPLQWNCQAEQCLENSATVGGARPKIVHFTDHKPFSGPRPGTHGHEFLCSVDELARRAQGLLPAATGAAAAVGTGAPEGQQQGEQPAAADGAGPAQHVQQRAQQQPGDAAPAAAQLGVPAPATGSGAAVQQQRLVQHALQQLDEQRLEHLDIVQQGNKKLPG